MGARASLVASLVVGMGLWAAKASVVASLVVVGPGYLANLVVGWGGMAGNRHYMNSHSLNRLTEIQSLGINNRQRAAGMGVSADYIHISIPKEDHRFQR